MEHICSDYMMMGFITFFISSVFLYKKLVGTFTEYQKQGVFFIDRYGGRNIMHTLANTYVWRGNSHEIPFFCWRLHYIIHKREGSRSREEKESTQNFSSSTQWATLVKAIPYLIYWYIYFYQTKILISGNIIIITIICRFLIHIIIIIPCKVRGNSHNLSNKDVKNRLWYKYILFTHSIQCSHPYTLWFPFTPPTYLHFNKSQYYGAHKICRYTICCINVVFPEHLVSTPQGCVSSRSELALLKRENVPP